MMRLILFLVLFLALFYVLRGLFKFPILQKKQNKGRPEGRFRQPPLVTDELVKDPICGVYCPKKDALSIHWKGKTYYFCSEKCRQEFKKEKNIG
jgi:YHS domain-containing protein